MATFDFGNSQEIDFTQEFLGIYESDLKFKISRFNIYELHTSNLYPSEPLYYYIVDEESNLGDKAVFGIKWNTNDKTLHAQTRVALLQGDPELMGYVVDALVITLKNQKIAEGKNQKVVG